MLKQSHFRDLTVNGDTMVTNGMPANQLTNAVWRKATKSHGGYECVELAAVGDQIAMRHSRHPDGPALIFTRGELAAFLAGAGDKEFDDLI